MSALEPPYGERDPRGMAARIGGIPEQIEHALDGLREREGWSRNALFKPIRVAVTGKQISPPIHWTLALMPRETALARLARVNA